MVCKQRPNGPIGRITTGGAITTYSAGIPPGVAIQGVTLGPDGALWFCESLGDRIGRITTKGKVTEYSQGITPGEHLNRIVAGLDGSLWFTESEERSSNMYSNAKIGRVTTREKITEYAVPRSDADPTGIVQGPEGNICSWRPERTGSGASTSSPPG